MGKQDPRVDAYISKAEGFAKPILTHVRELIHINFHELDETIKWGFPHFLFNGIVCSFASFKNHCSLGFWKASIMSDPYKLLEVGEKAAMGHFGKVRTLKDLPPDDILIQYIKEAINLNAKDVKIPKPKAAPRKELLPISPLFSKALTDNPLASKAFQGFSVSNKNEYLEWINEAKTLVTQTSRIEKSIEWLNEGKVRNWKYLKK